MTPEAFVSRRDQLRSLLLRARCYYVITLELWPTPERVDILNRFLGFFGLVRQAVIDAAFLSYAKAYDSDLRTASIRVLLDAAKANPSVLAPNASDGELDALEALVRSNDQTLGNLQRLRNQRLAHIDASPSGDMSLQKGELNQLVEDTERAFNDLSRMHDRSATMFLMQVDDTERRTRQVIETLQKAEDARHQRGAARIPILKLLGELERDPAIGAFKRAVVQKVTERLFEEEDRPWILLRDDLSRLSQETSSVEATRVITEIRALVDSALGL
ncbi:MAG: hypothetical protein HY533_02155 [Chloroflexi bacterium]|nr:hypothetical protein [Chloroflexota bacterium]